MKAKKICAITVLLAIILNLFTVSTSAMIIDNYFPGIKELIIFEPGVMLRNECKQTKLNLPFNVESVSFKYNIDRDSEMILEMDDDVYNIILPKDKTEFTFKFGEVIRRRDVEIKLTALQKTQLEYMKLDKVQISWYAPYQKELPALTEYEEKIYTSTVLNCQSPVLMVNGSTRYLNYENIDEKPLLLNDTLYLKVNELARALGLYYEDYPDKDYVLLRMDSDYELRVQNGKAYFEVGGNTGVKREVRNPFILLDGNTYAEVRNIAELFGKAVLYKDGTIVIDDSEVRASNVVNSESTMQTLKEYFASFTRGNGGTTYYVAQTRNASDNNPGTKELPFRTLKKAGDTAEAGDTVIIGGGTYRETLTPKNSGRADAPIIYQAAEGEEVIVSAFEELSGFARYNSELLDNGELYAVKTDIDMGEDYNFITYKGEPLIQGRYPNVQTAPEPYPWPDDVTSPLWPTKGDLKIGGKEFMQDGKIYSPNDLNQEDDYWKGAFFVGMIEEGWTLTHAKIKSSTQGSITIDRNTIDYWGNIFGKNYGVFPSDYGYITNSIKTLDTSGEWQLENGMLYIYPIDGVEPQALTVEVKARMVCINLRDKEYIQMKNINTTGGGINLTDSVMCVLNGGIFKYLSHWIYTMDAQSAFHEAYEKYGNAVAWTEHDSTYDRGEVGICVSGDNNAVINSEIDYSAGAGILLYGKHSYVENNVINDTGYGGTYLAGISISKQGWKPKTLPTGGHYIYNNTINNTGRAAIYISSTSSKTTESYMDNAESDRGSHMPCDIAFNYLYNTNIAGRDTGGIYFHGANVGNDMYYTKFHSNVVCNIQGSDNSVDYFQAFRNESYFYYDAWTSGMNFYDNVGFATNERQQSCSRYVSVYGGYWADHSDVGNDIDSGIIPGGKDAMTVDDFPGSKPFYAGAFAGKTDKFMLNYNGYEAHTYDYGVNDAKLLGNAYMDHGMINLPDENSMIEFSNVECKGGKYWMRLFFAGDKYNDPQLEVRLGDSYDTAMVYDITPAAHGNTLNSIQSEECFNITGNGTQHMWIKKVGGGSFKFAGFDFEFDPLYLYQPDNYLLGYTFTDYEIGEGKLSEGAPIKYALRYPNLMKWMQGGSARSTWNNTLYYDEVPLTQPFDKLEISTASGGKYTGSTLTLYVDSVDTEPICSLTLSSTNFNTPTIDEVVLDKSYDIAGHRLIVKFWREDGGGSVNFQYIKFVNTGANDKPVVTGGGAAKENEYKATSAESTGSVTANEECVTVDNGGTLCFDDVTFKGSAYSVKLKYALKDGTAPIELLVGNTLEDATSVNVELDSTGEKTGTKEVKISANDTQKLWIKNVGENKVDIYGFDIARCGMYALENAMYGSMLTSYQKGSCDSEPHINGVYVYDTWDNTLIYKDINIETDFDTIKLKCTSGGSFTGSNVSVYMDGSDKPLFTKKIDTMNWDNDPTVHEIKLDKTYKAGYHDFKVVFDGGNTKSCNFHYIQFIMSE